METALESPRYVVDGMHPDGNWSGCDNVNPPFVVFDKADQTWLPDTYPDRKTAQAVADRLNRESGLTLDAALDRWAVMAPGMWENDSGPADWHAVCNDDGIVAYFAKESDAFRFRLWMINRDLNP